MERDILLGTVFNIERFAVHDGPGIRTLVFLKGCPLRCQWCCNPEGMNGRSELGYARSLCQECRKCAAACPRRAIEPAGQGMCIDRDLCDLCGACVNACPAGALETLGRQIDVEAVVAEAARDEVFYRQSGGGITVSGGEPTMQAGFLRDLLAACRGRGWHTALETSGHCSRDTLSTLLPLVDLFLYDLKHVDGQKHEEGTGVPNASILGNLERLAQSGAAYVVRIPLIPGFNCDEEDLVALADFISRIAGQKPVVHLLPYHGLGTMKYDRVGRPYHLSGVQPPDKNLIEKALGIMKRYGLEATVGVRSGF